MKGFRILHRLMVLLLPSIARAETAANADQPVDRSVELERVSGKRPEAAMAAAWDRSVELERAGDIRGAEAVMVAAWGKKPDNYYAQLRLAYLALIANRTSAAVARYGRARLFPEANGDSDAVTGYANALALRGWKLAARGRTVEAKASWREALVLVPDQEEALAGLDSVTRPVTSPEVWTAYVGESFGSGRYQGFALFAQLPWRFFDCLTVRAAVRHIGWYQVGRPPAWAFSGESSLRWTVNEGYGGIGYDTPVVAAEALGFTISSGAFAIAGAGMRLRVGRAWGVATDAGVLHSDGRWQNSQIQPVAFVLLGTRWLLQAGARLTREAGATWPSAVAGVALLGRRLAVALRGHAGTEHWAADLASPSVLSIAPRSRLGGTATVSWAAIRTVRVAAMAEADALAAEGATGTFWSMSLGLELRIFSL